MPSNYTRPTVFISSRMDETSAARRATFEAVLEAGGIPLLFEAFPYASAAELGGWEFAEPRYSEILPTRRRILEALEREHRARERARMDQLLQYSNLFIGIYGSTIGAPAEYLGWRVPIEYEILRFLIQQRLQIKYAGHLDLEKLVGKRLAKYFSRVGRFGRPPRIKGKLKREYSLIRQQLRLLKSLLLLKAHWGEAQEGSPGLADSPGIEPLVGCTLLDSERRVVSVDWDWTLRRFREENDYARIHEGRVLMLVQDVGRDRQASTALLGSILSAPHVQFGVREDSNNKDADKTYLPATTELAKIVYEWVSSKRRELDSAAQPEDRALAVVWASSSHKDSKGDLERVCREVFRSGFNIDHIQAGSTSGDASLVIGISSYYGLGSVDSRITRLAQGLQTKLSPRISVSVEPDEVEDPGSGEFGSDPEPAGKVYRQLQATMDPQADERMFTLQVFVADVPGMLYRVAERVHRHGCDIREVVVRSGPADQPVRYVTPQRKEILLHLDTPQGERADDPKFLESLSRLICTDLRFVIGVYDVRLGRGRAGGKGIPR